MLLLFSNQSLSIASYFILTHHVCLAFSFVLLTNEILFAFRITPEKLGDRYIQAMKKVKDDTMPKVCVHLQGNSLNDDITKHLTSTNDAIIVQYTQNG
jgi:hypothetical protein